LLKLIQIFASVKVGLGQSFMGLQTVKAKWLKGGESVCYYRKWIENRKPDSQLIGVKEVEAKG
jgi:hypothetical protein